MIRLYYTFVVTFGAAGLLVYLIRSIVLLGGWVELIPALVFGSLLLVFGAWSLKLQLRRLKGQGNALSAATASKPEST